MVISGAVFSQDTLLLHAKPDRIVNVLELDENYVTIQAPGSGPSAKKEKIKISDLRRIKYKNGYVEKFSHQAGGDMLQLVNTRVIKGQVAEVNLDDIVLDINNGDNSLIIPLDSVANITYANGYIEKYHSLTTNIASLNPINSNFQLQQANVHRVDTTGANQAALVPATNTAAGTALTMKISDSNNAVKQTAAQAQLDNSVGGNNAGNSSTAAVPGTTASIAQNNNSSSPANQPGSTQVNNIVRSVQRVVSQPSAVVMNSQPNPVVIAAAQKNDSRSKRKGGNPQEFTLSSIGTHPYIGIGLIIDSVTGLSRSFAFYELVKNNLLANDVDTLYPVMTDYHFNATYAITGIAGDDYFRLKLYKNGKKLKDIITPNDWKEVYEKLSQALQADHYVSLSNKLKRPDEGTVDNIDAKHIYDCMPGSIENTVPFNTIIDTFKQFANIHYSHSKNAYADAKELYGKYFSYKENKLFFFRNEQVPYNLQRAAKPLVFPLYRSLTPSLTYLSCGKQLSSGMDFGAAISCYYATLVSSNNILASPPERALIRAISFKEISRAHLSLSPGRIYTAGLFDLGASLNDAYLDSYQAREDQKTYYDNINAIKDLCVKAEEKARDIRKQKRLGALMAAVSYAGAMTTVSAYDNTTSNAFMSQAENYLTTSMTQANEVSVALKQQYNNVEDNIKAEEFISSDGSAVEVGKSFLAGEIYYYLKLNPQLVKKTMMSFASDKPKLKNLLINFYAATGNNTAELNAIFMHISEMEARILNTEIRNLPISQKTISSF